MPEAPVIMATLSETSNSERGFAERLADHVHHFRFRCGNVFFGSMHSDDAQPQPSPSGQRHGNAKKCSAAGDRVEIAVDVLDAGDAVDHQDLVRGFPIGEIFITSRPVARRVLVEEVRWEGPGP